jgi:hypothetical protein
MSMPVLGIGMDLQLRMNQNLPPKIEVLLIGITFKPKCGSSPFTTPTFANSTIPPFFPLERSFLWIFK